MIVAWLSQPPVPKSRTAAQRLLLGSGRLALTVLIRPFTIQRQVKRLRKGSVIVDSQRTSRLPFLTKPLAEPSILKASSFGHNPVWQDPQPGLLYGCCSILHSCHSAWLSFPFMTSTLNLRARFAGGTGAA